MSTTTFFGNMARLSVVSYDGTPITNVLSVLRGLECNISWEVAELYGTDSILRVDEAKYGLKVEVKIKYSKWDPGITTDWLTNLLNPVSGGAGGGGTVADVNQTYIDKAMFTILGTNGEYLYIECDRVYWDNFPINLAENDFVIRDLTGHAQTAIVTYT